MFVGHGLAAFAIVAAGARWRGWSRSAVLRVAIVAGLFATLPDVDIVYALTGLVGATPASEGLVDSFWTAGNRVHRGVTHSLVVGALAAAAVGLFASDGTQRIVGGTALLAVIGIALVASGVLAAAIAGLFVAGAVALVAVADRLGVDPEGVTAAAAVGLLTHPFGDVFTGEPPDFLYPLDVTLVSERVVLAGDPTLHLLAAFGVELAVVWVAVATYFRVTDRSLAAHVDRRAALGTGYAAAALVLPAPTLDVSYHFVFSVLAVGAVGVSPPPRERPRTWRGLVTALAAVTLAAVAYTVAYLLL